MLPNQDGISAKLVVYVRRVNIAVERLVIQHKSTLATDRVKVALACRYKLGLRSWERFDYLAENRPEIPQSPLAIVADSKNAEKWREVQRALTADYEEDMKRMNKADDERAKAIREAKIEPQ